MKKLMAFFAAFLLVFTQGVMAFEQSPLSYATSGALQGNTIQDGEVQILSDAEMAEVEGEILPLALAVAELGLYGYRVYTVYNAAKKITTIAKVVDKSGKVVNSVLSETTAAGAKYTNYTSNVLKMKDVESGLVKAGYTKTPTGHPEIFQFVKGADKYTLRPFSTSTKTPTLEHLGTSKSAQTVIRLSK